MAFSRETAETLALRALSWLVTEDDLVGVFLGSSGMDEKDLRESAGDPEFLGSVLDFILMDDAWIIRFCDGQNLPYDHVRLARAALPGGEQIHWT
ncbi:DUF3572 domain-containing protein [Marinovum sp. 2_MG-2023]|uniref:DUF3572 domain-containing protein n=1 Tax=Roseobacteraceae TaxID=2854170 RepID=UPI001FD3E4DF|nr:MULTISPECIES: DUF3572 domain-containing protein [Roseobacteraceae]MCJ7871906.1 DUF3572 domain-containing protein [Phaeobacter sp. J2-8]MDO6728766.1 DUF3572 domain-containing protein [Marinovum sp. 2_MG-2023]MDO6777818.1 DUF3572 domain-containing protein [Marinovum sp. 1_MG-2023]